MNSYIAVVTGETLTDDLIAQIILDQCPGIKDVATGLLTQWDKNTPQVNSASKWAADNSELLKSYTKHVKRWHGLTFTPNSYDVSAFNKLLRMVGLTPITIGQQGRVRRYRLKE